MSGVQEILEAQVRDSIQEQITNMTKLNDVALEEAVRVYKTESEELDCLGLHLAPLDLPNWYYEGKAAQQILRDRHGEEYVLNLFGLRKPKTLGERVLHFFTSRYPVTNPD
ncbi:MAG TPA: hypothetical protein VJH20_04575 [Candidatus Nanoarchaeia archaeon]|nr:hypothetical protein [Candidatus Nanoarchaeia archaeon]